MALTAWLTAALLLLSSDAYIVHVPRVASVPRAASAPRVASAPAPRLPQPRLRVEAEQPSDVPLPFRRFEQQQTQSDVCNDNEEQSEQTLSSYIDGRSEVWRREYMQAAAGWQQAAAVRQEAATAKHASEERRAALFVIAAEAERAAKAAAVDELALAMQRADEDAAAAQAEAQSEMEAALRMWAQTDQQCRDSMDTAETTMARALQAAQVEEEAAQVAWTAVQLRMRDSTVRAELAELRSSREIQQAQESVASALTDLDRLRDELVRVRNNAAAAVAQVQTENQELVAALKLEQAKALKAKNVAQKALADI